MLILVSLWYLAIAMFMAVEIGKGAHSDESATLAIVAAALWPLALLVFTASNLKRLRRGEPQ